MSGSLQNERDTPSDARTVSRTQTAPRVRPRPQFGVYAVCRRTEEDAMSSPATATASTLTHRDRAILRAVAAGSAELVAGAEPDMYLDGLTCSDQFAVHRLVHAGLIAAIGPTRTGQRIAARLTADGAEFLAA
jgi:hypothetical protein